MMDTILTRLAAVDEAALVASNSQAAYLAVQANADALSVTARIDEAARLAARRRVVAGLVLLGEPAVISNPDGTDSVVELDGADYAVRVLGDASRPLPSS